MSFLSVFRWFFFPPLGCWHLIVSHFVSSSLGDFIYNTMDKTHLINQKKKIYLAKLWYSSGEGWVLTTPWAPAVSQKQKFLFLNKCETDLVYLESIWFRLCNVLHMGRSLSLFGFKERFSLVYKEGVWV